MASMEICSSGHEEIVYIGRSCPACDLLDEISQLQKNLEETEKDLVKKDEELAEYENMNIGERILWAVDG